MILRLRPLEARPEALMRLVAGVKGILFSEARAAEGAIVFAKACELGLGGIVSKWEGSCISSLYKEWTEPQLAQDDKNPTTTARRSRLPSPRGSQSPAPMTRASHAGPKLRRPGLEKRSGRTRVARW